MEQQTGPQRAKTRGNSRRALTTAPLTTEARQHAHIDELCHRMTVAESRAVRMQLCVELKRAIADLLAEQATSSMSSRDPFQEEFDAIRAACNAMSIYDVIKIREQAQAIAAEPRKTTGFKG